MGTRVIEEHLTLPPVGVAHTYAVHTRLEMRLPGRQLLQNTHTLLRLTVRRADPASSLLEVALLEQRADAPTPQLELLAAIAREQSPLLVRCDAHGAPQRILNKLALAAQWQAALPALAARYRTQPGAAALLALVAPQYAEDNAQLEQALLQQGPRAALLPGFYGLHSWQGDARPATATIPQALGPVALPLHLHWTAAPADVFAPSVVVEGTGRLDRTKLDEAACQNFLDSLRGGVWTGPPAPLNVFWRAQYTVGRQGQGLLAGRQAWRVAVDKLYFADISHVVHPATALPPA